MTNQPASQETTMTSSINSNFSFINYVTELLQSFFCQLATILYIVNSYVS
jgi:hypothetical protein